jgi:hypothetical protein
MGGENTILDTAVRQAPIGSACDALSFIEQTSGDVSNCLFLPRKSPAFWRQAPTLQAVT